VLVEGMSMEKIGGEKGFGGFEIGFLGESSRKR